MSFKRALLTWSMIALASVLLVACGGSDNESSAPATMSDAPQTSANDQPAAEPDPAPMSDDGDNMAADSTTETHSDADMGDQSAESGDAAMATAPAAASSENPVTVGDDGVARLTIGSTDTMQYTVRAFTVEAGQEVELTLVHEGSLPIDVMGHNVVILPAGEDYVAFSREVMSNGGSVENDYLPEEQREGLVAYTQLLGGGETDTITFTAPDEPGEYPFLCTFPGHFGVMNGTMTVL